MEANNGNESRPIRRLSIFENKDEESVDLVESEWKKVFGETDNFSETLKNNLYPREYVENLQTELELLESKEKEAVNKWFEDVKISNELPSDESILDTEQKQYLNHISSTIDQFTRSAEALVNKVKVIQRQNELEVEDIQKKTDMLIILKNSSESESYLKNGSSDSL